MHTSGFEGVDRIVCCGFELAPILLAVQVCCRGCSDGTMTRGSSDVSAGGPSSSSGPPPHQRSEQRQAIDALSATRRSAGKIGSCSRWDGMGWDGTFDFERIALSEGMHARLCIVYRLWFPSLSTGIESSTFRAHQTVTSTACRAHRTVAQNITCTQSLRHCLRSYITCCVLLR